VVLASHLGTPHWLMTTPSTVNPSGALRSQSTPGQKTMDLNTTPHIGPKLACPNPLEPLASERSSHQQRMMATTSGLVSVSARVVQALSLVPQLVWLRRWVLQTT
jgi:hypothetical protein